MDRSEHAITDSLSHSDVPPEVERLIRRLPRRSAARAAAERIQNATAPDDDSIRALLERFQRRRRVRFKEKMVVAWVLGHAGRSSRFAHAAAETLVGIMDERPGRNVGCMTAGGCLFWYLPWTWLWIALCSIRDGRRNRVRAIAARSLGVLGEPVGAASLARAVRTSPTRAANGDKAVREAAAGALPEALKRVAPESIFTIIPAETPRYLCRLLTPDNEWLSSRVLQSLELIGTEKEIPAVDRFARIAPYTSSASFDVRGMAVRVLNVMRDRAARAREAATLLRPSSCPNAAEETLLRPAGGPQSGVHSSTLLRPLESAEPDAYQQNLAG